MVLVPSHTDGQAFSREPHAARARDHGHPAPTRAGDRGGGARRDGGCADLLDRAGALAAARGEGACRTRGGWAAVRVHAGGATRGGQALGGGASAADVLRRIGRGRGGGAGGELAAEA